MKTYNKNVIIFVLLTANWNNINKSFQHFLKFTYSREQKRKSSQLTLTLGKCTFTARNNLISHCCCYIID